MKRILTLVFTLLIFSVAVSAPPYDVTVTFDPPSSGPTPDSYNFYIDDCAISGPASSPFATVTNGQTFVGALIVDGTFEMCVRSVNGAGIQPNPGQIATVTVNDLPLSGPIENLSIAIDCPNGSCTVNVTVN